MCDERAARPDARPDYARVCIRIAIEEILLSLMKKHGLPAGNSFSVGLDSAELSRVALCRPSVRVTVNVSPSAPRKLKPDHLRLAYLRLMFVCIFTLACSNGLLTRLPCGNAHS